MQASLDDLIWIGTPLLGVGIGLLLLLFPYHLIHLLGKLTRSYHKGFTISDQTSDNRVQLPWSRYFQDGLTYSQFWQEAIDNPKRFTAWSAFIRLLGGGIAIIFGGVLLLDLLARVTGVMK